MFSKGARPPQAGGSARTHALDNTLSLFSLARARARAQHTLATRRRKPKTNSRYAEAVTSVQAMTARWGDAANTVLSFDKWTLPEGASREQLLEVRACGGVF